MQKETTYKDTGVNIEEANALVDDYGDARREAINNRFDAQVSEAQQSLIDRGIFNSTVWDPVEAGIERERTFALNEVEERISDRSLNLEHKLYEEQKDVRSRILAARERLFSALQSASESRLTQRNTLVDALARFMERRTDSYPDLTAVGNLAASLGSGTPNTFRS